MGMEAWRRESKTRTARPPVERLARLEARPELQVGTIAMAVARVFHEPSTHAILEIPSFPKAKTFPSWQDLGEDRRDEPRLKFHTPRSLPA